MKTKLLAVMLLAGGTMFAQSRFSVGVGFGGYPQPVPYVPACPAPGYISADGYCVENYGYTGSFYGGYVAPRFDNHFGDRDDRGGFARGFEGDRNRGFAGGGQDRNSGGQNRTQAQSRGNRNQGGSQNNHAGSGNGFRGR